VVVVGDLRQRNEAVALVAALVYAL